MKVGQHRRKSERHSENTEVAEMLHGFPKTSVPGSKHL